ncbi:thymidylate kinase-domain-containing protein [Astrocystis sublimbata]|nr:thymidylate kinase-domain-containing protein [Astrocystis sublimbata]
MASINDLATAATIASSAVALQSSPEGHASSQPASPAPRGDADLDLDPDPASPPSPSPSAQLQAQAQETHAQKFKSASKSPASEEAQQQQQKKPSLTPSTSDAMAASHSPSPAPEGNSITVNVGGGPVNNGAAVDADAGGGGGGAPSTPPPVLAAPQISPRDPAQATIPPQLTPEVASAHGEEVSPGKGDSMAGVEYEDEYEDESDNEPRKPPVRGAFIVFEGMDRAGKTTQAKLLQVRCIESNREVKFMRFPDRTTPIGQMIDAYLKGDTEIEDHVIHLLFSANRWEAVKKIKAELEAGTTIICDRFYHSGIVYSAAKQLPSLSLSWAKAPEVGLPRPDMVLFLDLEESVARTRGGWGGEIYEKGEMQRRVRELFWGLSMGDLGTNKAAEAAGKDASSENERVPLRNGTNSNFVRVRDGRGVKTEGEFRQEEEDIQIVDADQGVEDLADKIWEVVRGRIEAVERGEEGKTVRIVG